MRRIETNIRQWPVAMAVGLLALSAANVSQAQCRPGNGNSDIFASTPASDFQDGSDGTVLHVPTGLVWQRCTLGQSWTGNGCAGSADLLDWEDGLQVADIHVQDGQSDWRVPDRNELNSIVENRCFLPALNDQVFPDAPGGATWTSSPAASQSGQAWSVDFDSGTVEQLATSQENVVRLVRTARP